MDYYQYLLTIINICKEELRIVIFSFWENSIQVLFPEFLSLSLNVFESLLSLRNVEHFFIIYLSDTFLILQLLFQVIISLKIIDIYSYNPE